MLEADFVKQRVDSIVFTLFHRQVIGDNLYNQIFILGSIVNGHYWHKTLERHKYNARKCTFVDNRKRAENAIRVGFLGNF